MAVSHSGHQIAGAFFAVLAALLVKVEEGQLRDALDARFDRLVGVVPVDRGAEILHLAREVVLVLRTDLTAEFLKLSALVVLVTDIQF